MHRMNRIRLQLLALLLGMQASFVSAFTPASGLVLSAKDPASLRVGQPVVLVLRGIWHDSCVPARFNLSIAAYGEQRRVLRLWNEAAGCAAVQTPFEVELSPVIFEEPGVVRFAVVYDGDPWRGSGDAWLSEHSLAIQPADTAGKSISAFAVDGAWYVPALPGSGLLLNHQRTGNDRVLGTWLNFDQSGSPRWYLLDGARWTTPTRLEGNATLATNGGFGCTAQFPNPDCDFAPTRADHVEVRGQFVIEFSDDSRAMLHFRQPGSDGAMVDSQPIPLTKL